MTHSPDNIKCASHSLFKLMQNNHIEYVYLGDFTPSITDSLLSLAEINLETENDNIKLKKRVYFILVEGLQNVTRHQKKAKIENDLNPALLIFQRIDENFYITIGNLIDNSEIEKLKKHLEKINNLGQEELKAYYREILASQHISHKGGAGLGLIEIARKSGNKLIFDFEKINDEVSFFYLQTKIIAEPATALDLDGKSLQKLKHTHKKLVDCNVILSFAGVFIQEKLIYILSILEQRLNKDTILKSKLFNTMVELLQNIVKHADDYVWDNISGHYAIFYISEDEKYLYITTGNYILKEKAEKISQRITWLNSLNLKEITKERLRILKKHKEQDLSAEHNGLGLIDIRIKSREKINFYLEEVDDKFDFLTIEVKIKKKQKIVDTLDIPKTEDTPRVYFSPREAKFIIEGSSFPEDTIAFYEQIIEWLEKYKEVARNFSIFEFHYEYFNSPTKANLIKIFKILNEISKDNVLIVKWYYDPLNEDSYEMAITLKEIFEDMDIQLIESDNLLH